MTATAPGGVAASSYPAAGPHQNPDNRLEQILVHQLLDGVVEELTDRSGSTHPFPWTPDQNVRVGVLGVTIVPPQQGVGDTQLAGGAPSEEDEPDGRASAAPLVAPAIENPGVIGVDFVIAGTPAIVELMIDVHYALYHQLLPDFADIATEAARRFAAAASNPRRRPTVPITPTWRRDNRTVTLNVTIPVNGDEHTVTSEDLPGGCPLAADADAAVAAHYNDPQALWKLTSNQTLPVAAASGTEAEFGRALAGRRDSTWVPRAPRPKLTISTLPTVDGNTAVSVSLTNALFLPAREFQDLSIYDARMTVTVLQPAQLLPRPLGLALEDCRYTNAATVVGRGRGCVARPGDHHNIVIAETLPLHIQRHAESADPAGADISFGGIAAGWNTTLPTLGAEMRTFLRNWDFTAATTSEGLVQVTELRNRFEAEAERFELGLDLLRSDSRLALAFEYANQTFAASRGATAGWRLFQLVFIVTELGALAGRENPTDARLRKELDAVDVLWFPTGGGKTEAYLGLITVALFYDRLRGKELGTTAWLLFPLRMLSVQQLSRVGEVVYHAEHVRVTAGLGGDPFTLGYFVGSGNTPNRLAYRDNHGWWPGLAEFAKLPTKERDRRRLVGA